MYFEVKVKIIEIIIKLRNKKLDMIIFIIGFVCVEKTKILKMETMKNIKIPIVVRIVLIIITLFHIHHLSRIYNHN